MLVPDAIVAALDELEQFNDDPNRVLRNVGALRWLLSRWAAEQVAITREAAETIERLEQDKADLTARLHEVVV